MPQIVVRHGEETLGFHVPAQEAVIGSAQEADIRVPFRAVSRRHALLFATSASLRLRDTGSKNNLILDGKPVRGLLPVPELPVQIGRALHWIARLLMVVVLLGISICLALQIVPAAIELILVVSGLGLVGWVAMRTLRSLKRYGELAEEEHTLRRKLATKRLDENVSADPKKRPAGLLVRFRCQIPLLDRSEGGTMNANAKILPLVIALSVLSAQALMANDDPKKKQAEPPPKAQPQAQPQARPQAQPQAQPQARPQAQPQARPQAQPQAQGRPQTQPQAQQHGTAPLARAQAPNTPSRSTTNRPGAPGTTAHQQPGRAAPMSRQETHARIQQINRAHPTQLDRTHAREAFKVERGHFTRQMAPFRFAASHRGILTRMHIVPGTYHYRRSAFYDAYGWATPAYVYGMYPRYGLWDSSFLAFALHHVADDQYAMMLYNHWGDPAIQQWVQDTHRLAENDPELSAHVEAMNGRMSQLEQSGTARDESYVPPDAQDIALSPDAVDQLAGK